MDDFLDASRSDPIPAAVLGPDASRKGGASIAEAALALIGRQCGDGHFRYELEADTTISSEYILLEHFLGDVDAATEAKLATYIRRRQADHGGWPLFHGGDLDVSATVKAYYALKLAGDSPDAPHMVRAREAVLAAGGAARANVFTRITLALFGQMPWRAVPAMPIEIVLLPRWFPFHLSKVSYWSRTVIVPLLILMALQPRAANPRSAGIAELFAASPDDERIYIRPVDASLPSRLLVQADRLLRAAEPAMARYGRRRAIARALAFMRERLNGEDGLGAIFPAMANAVMALYALGHGQSRDYAVARDALRRLIADRGDHAHCQPCLSPIWDTALACHALLEAAEAGDGDEAAIRGAVRKALDWLVGRQITETRGDWAETCPDAIPGGWAFQYRNDHYPDLDDTAVVVMALHRADPVRYCSAIRRGVDWILALQSRNGGWAAFEVDNTYGYLNHIPFADHGALLDPPTADVTARCLGMLAQIGLPREHPAIRRAVSFLRECQEPDGSWYGRWGINYVYGTWSVLCGLNAVGEDMTDPFIRKAVTWLKERQRADGGWGEDGAAYWGHRRAEAKASTPSQTAWALLALMAAGDVDDPAVRRGVGFLETCPRREDRWDEPYFTAVGFPRVFYLRYHGYAAYFPLWALARYSSLTSRGNRRVAWGL